MTVARALLLLVLVLDNRARTSRAWLLANETDCSSEVLVDLTGAHFQGNGSAVIDGVYYPVDAIEYAPGQDNGYADAKDNSTAYRLMGCPCQTIACLSLCCVEGNCTRWIDLTKDESFFPIYDPVTDLMNVNASAINFWQIAWDPCHGAKKYTLAPKIRSQDEFKLLSDGTLRRLAYRSNILNYTSFCVEKVENEWRIFLCSEEPSDSVKRKKFPVVLMVSMLISVPFLIATFLVYILIHELRNIHGLTVCSYVAALLIGYLSFATLKIIYQGKSVPNLACSMHGICLFSKIFTDSIFIRFFIRT